MYLQDQPTTSNACAQDTYQEPEQDNDTTLGNYSSEVDNPLRSVDYSDNTVLFHQIDSFLLGYLPPIEAEVLDTLCRKAQVKKSNQIILSIGNFLHGFYDMSGNPVKGGIKGSRNTIKKAIAGLEEKGFVAIEGRAEGGQVYLVNRDLIVEKILAVVSEKELDATVDRWGNQIPSRCKNYFGNYKFLREQISSFLPGIITPRAMGLLKTLLLCSSRFNTVDNEITEFSVSMKDIIEPKRTKKGMVMRSGLGADRKTIRKALKELRGKGFIDFDQKKFKRKNEITLNIDRIKKMCKEIKAKLKVSKRAKKAEKMDENKILNDFNELAFSKKCQFLPLSDKKVSISPTFGDKKCQKLPTYSYRRDLSYRKDCLSVASEARIAESEDIEKTTSMEKSENTSTTGKLKISKKHTSTSSTDSMENSAPQKTRTRNRRIKSVSTDQSIPTGSFREDGVPRTHTESVCTQSQHTPDYQESENDFDFEDKKELSARDAIEAGESRNKEKHQEKLNNVKIANMENILLVWNDAVSNYKSSNNDVLVPSPTKKQMMKIVRQFRFEFGECDRWVPVVYKFVEEWNIAMNTDIFNWMTTPTPPTVPSLNFLAGHIKRVVTYHSRGVVNDSLADRKDKIASIGNEIALRSKEVGNLVASKERLMEDLVIMSIKQDELSTLDPYIELQNKYKDMEKEFNENKKELEIIKHNTSVSSTTKIYSLPAWEDMD